MPSYVYACNECGDRQEQIFKITEYQELTLKDKACKAYIPEGETSCGGAYDHVFDSPPAHSFKGPGWTPTFYPERDNKS